MARGAAASSAALAQFARIQMTGADGYWICADRHVVVCGFLLRPEWWARFARTLPDRPHETIEFELCAVPFDVLDGMAALVESLPLRCPLRSIVFAEEDARDGSPALANLRAACDRRARKQIALMMMKRGKSCSDAARLVSEYASDWFKE